MTERKRRSVDKLKKLVPDHISTGIPGVIQATWNIDKHRGSEQDSSKSSFNFVVYAHKNLKLHIIHTGSELMNIVYGAESGNINSDEPEDKEEEKLISSFMAELEEWDALPDLPISIRVGLQLDMTQQIDALVEEGFLVIGSREKTKAKIGDLETPWTIAHVNVIRAFGSKIAEVYLPEELKGDWEKVKSMSSEEKRKALKLVRYREKEFKS